MANDPGIGDMYYAPMQSVTYDPNASVTIPALDQTQPGPLTDQQALINAANSIGANPRDLATVMSYESAGTMSPAKWGGKGM